MFINSFLSITFVIVFLLNYFDQINSLKWFNDWSDNCDFPGNDLWSVKSKPDDCIVQCAAYPRCTHFVWTSSDKICWLKSGSVTKDDAVEKPLSSGRCGLLISGVSEDEEYHCESENGDASCYENLPSVISLDEFKCVFDDVDAALVENYYQQFLSAKWKPKTNEEAVVYLSYVYLITSSLRKVDIYCQSTSPWVKNPLWNHDSIDQNRIFFGKSWFDMVWPCNKVEMRRSIDRNSVTENDNDELETSTLNSLKLHNKTTVLRSQRQLSTNLIDQNPFERRDPLFSRRYDPISRQINSYQRIRQCFKLVQKFSEFQ